MATLTKVRFAGILAQPALEALLAEARRYPASYDRERVMAEADRILDYALDKAAFVEKKRPSCVVCDGFGCEHCPKVAVA